MKNVRRALTATTMALGLAAAGGATALAQPSGSLGGDGGDIKLSQGETAVPGGCAVEVENIGSETAEGVSVKSPLGFSDELGDIEAGQSATAEFIDCESFPFPIPFYGTTTNGDANLLDNFVIVDQNAAPEDDVQTTEPETDGQSDGAADDSQTAEQPETEGQSGEATDGAE